VKLISFNYAFCDTAVYQQQETAHGAQQNSFMVGMGSLSCGKLFADWPEGYTNECSGNRRISP
jgi:hypothetical protein